jgi:hypothetical protein
MLDVVTAATTATVNDSAPSAANIRGSAGGACRSWSGPVWFDFVLNRIFASADVEGVPFGRAGMAQAHRAEQL